MNMIYDVIIIGGSYAGLSAALALGRAKRNVLIIDSNKPCNKQTPHSHNFLTHDGDKPSEISAIAKAEVLTYPTVKFIDGEAISAKEFNNRFEVTLADESIFTSRKILLATGLMDVLPEIPGFKECWAISVIHCPYCHGYEVKDEKVGILLNGDMAFDMSKMIHHWNNDVTLLTNGLSQLTEEQSSLLKSKSIKIIETKLSAIQHQDGYLNNIVFQNGEKLNLAALYAKPKMVQHSDIYAKLNCEINQNGLLVVDAFQKTTNYGVYAAGDCTTMFRSLAAATAAGSMAGAMINKDLIWEDF
ncbi:NAD(P)/FAD-dependent oxidoreductase [Pedobacter aquatilis]|uniref:NAD(P)/FAD-dependent oxidoreductase n=1 Tax=Pedobacter aquatilis TaxID=351343 RepID=UPI0025B49D1C|nr:NAD(P)/FAD-dependent oxidoreductase [Pedobacter aquatilis]MDN3585166.1 NAD(P)/FAD-dependent oxidoreductase [Pedobacter aquatilis]